MLRRSQQDFRGAQRARAQNHHVCGDGKQRSLELFPTYSRHFALNDPLIVLALDPAHGNFGKDFGAMIRGVGQVVHDQGVLGGVVAAGDAIPAIRAFMLFHADVVCSFDGEVDVDGRPIELLAQMLSGLLESAEFRKLRHGLRIGIGLQHLFRERSGREGCRADDALADEVIPASDEAVSKLGGPGRT